MALTGSITPLQTLHISVNFFSSADSFDLRIILGKFFMLMPGGGGGGGTHPKFW